MSAAGHGNITGNFGGSGGAVTLNDGAILAAADGLIALTATVEITLNGSATVTTGPGGSVSLTSDDVTIAGTASIGPSEAVTMRNFTAGLPINIGADAPLGLTDAELDRIAADTLIVGRDDALAAGDIGLSGAIDLSHGANIVSVLHLVTGGSVVPSGSEILTVGMLAVEADGGIGVAQTPLQTTALGGFAARVGDGGVFVSSVGGLTIGSVDGVHGIASSSGEIIINVFGGLFTINRSVQTPGDIRLTALESTPAQSSDDLTINAAATIRSDGAVAIQAGDSLTLATGAVVQADAIVTFVGGFRDDGNGGAVNFLGTARGSSVSVLGSAGNDAFVINPGSTVALVPIDGIDGSDTFTVTPKAATTFLVIGGVPTSPATPGDVLTVNTAGTMAPALAFTSTSSGHEGSYTFDNREPVNFQEIETITTRADLALTMTDRPEPVISGQDITYTLTVSNLGGVAARNVRLTDTVPANTTFVSFVQTPGPPASTLNVPPLGGAGDVTAVIDRLEAGQSATFTLVVRTTTGLAHNRLIGNGAAVATDTIESSEANNSATATTRIGPVPYIAVGAAPGGPPLVAVYTPTGRRIGKPVATFLAYAANFSGGVRVAVGDVNGDGTADIVTAPGPGGPNNVLVIDGTKLRLIPPGKRVRPAVLLANVRGFPGTAGMVVAAGDVNADGRDDVIIGAGGGPPRVRVYDGARIRSAKSVANFLAYGKTFRGGVTVAAGDVNGDGRADVVTAPAAGARRVQVIDGTKLHARSPDGRISGAALLSSFVAFAPAFRGGVNVATGDINGDRRADVIVAPAFRMAPQIKVIDASSVHLVTSSGEISPSALLANQLVFAQSFRGGVQVGVTELDLDGLAEVLVGTGPTKRRVLGLDVLQGDTELRLRLGFEGASLAGI
jgi:uncharacterized repeat protein (TIGR01451 family)